MKKFVGLVVVALLGCASPKPEQRAFERLGEFAAYDRFLATDTVVFAEPTADAVIELVTARRTNASPQHIDRLTRNLEFWMHYFEPRVQKLVETVQDERVRHQP